MTRQNPTRVDLVSAGANSDVVGRSVGSFRPLNSIVERVYEISVPQDGALAVINTGAPIESFLSSTTIPPEGSTIALNNRATAQPTYGISYTLASDTNNNGQLDSNDQFHDFENQSNNVAGTVVFNKSVSPGTYFLEINDTNGSSSSLDRLYIFYDPGESGLVLDTISDPSNDGNSEELDGENSNGTSNRRNPETVFPFEIEPNLLFFLGEGTLFNDSNPEDVFLVEIREPGTFFIFDAAISDIGNLGIDNQNVNISVVQDVNSNNTLEDTDIVLVDVSSNEIIEGDGIWLIQPVSPGTYFLEVQDNGQIDSSGQDAASFYNFDAYYVQAENEQDFNSDGSSDLVWRNSATGQNSVWYMNNTTRIGSAAIAPVPNSDWDISGVGDFNSDSRDDLVWRNAATGQNAIWYMNGTNRIDSAFFAPVPSSDWDIAAVADFNSDDQDDLLWRNSETGVNAVWYMNNTQRIGSTNLEPVTNVDWDIKGVGDFNDDGFEDIVWRNSSSGLNTVWYMNETQRIGSTNLNRVANQDWDIAGVNDFNGDSKPDLVWRNGSTGQNTVWYMDNNTFLDGADFSAVPNSDWTVIA